MGHCIHLFPVARTHTRIETTFEFMFQIAIMYKICSVDARISRFSVFFDCICLYICALSIFLISVYSISNANSNHQQVLPGIPLNSLNIHNLSDGKELKARNTTKYISSVDQIIVSITFPKICSDAEGPNQIHAKFRTILQQTSYSNPAPNKTNEPIYDGMYM